jgi:hypothetical protein
MALPIEKKNEIVRQAKLTPRPTNKEIAKTVNCTAWTVTRICREAQVPTK